MRTALFLMFFILITCSAALANWSEDFKATYSDQGIDQAVVAALAEGANPDQIVKTALPLRGLIKEYLVKALFCAIAQPDTIQDAAVNNGISKESVQEGYQLALNECSRMMDEHLNASLDSTQSYPGNTSSSRESRRTNYASPWKFQ